MAEVSALRKHPCPQCGGDAEWNAAKRALACPYCGTILPWSEGETPFGASIVEHDLKKALKKSMMKKTLVKKKKKICMRTKVKNRKKKSILNLVSIGHMMEVCLAINLEDLEDTTAVPLDIAM